MARRKLKKIALQPQGKEIPSSSLSARLGVKSAPQRIEMPSNLPLLLMALFKAMVLMLSEHKTLELVEDATFGLRVEYIYVSNKDKIVNYLLSICLYLFCISLYIIAVLCLF